MPNDFYVYVLFDFFAVPRYVGKGRGKRDEVHERATDPRNLLKNEFIERTWIMLGEVPKIRVRETMAENDAFALEVALIAAIGRLDLGTGPLVNMTAGGDGFDQETAKRGRRIAGAGPNMNGPNHRAAIAVAVGRTDVREKMSATQTKRYEDPVEREKSGRSISTALRANPVEMERRRTQYVGTIWITDGGTAKRVPKDGPIPNGWRRGKVHRKKLSASFGEHQSEIRRGEIWINDGATLKHHPKDEPIPEGWRRGWIKKSIA